MSAPGRPPSWATLGFDASMRLHPSGMTDPVSWARWPLISWPPTKDAARTMDMLPVLRRYGWEHVQTLARRYAARYGVRVLVYAYRDEAGRWAYTIGDETTRERADR